MGELLTYLKLRSHRRRAAGDATAAADADKIAPILLGFTRIGAA